MKDAYTQKPIRVMPVEDAGPYIRLPAAQVDAVVQLLTSRGIRCWRSEDILSVDGRPPVGWVHLSKNEKASVAQDILDNVP